MAAHLGGIHLAQLAQAAAVADAAGDSEFAERCRSWLRQGSEVLEADMWLGTHYVNYWDRTSGDRSDLIMANQLDGQWMARMAGLSDVFDGERAERVLDTVRRTCIEPHPYGAVNFADLSGRATTSGEGKPGWNYNPYAFFVPETVMLAATYLYAGQTEVGLDLARRCWTNLCEQGLLWDQPNLLNAATGEPIYGNDYYQNMIIWALLPALVGGDVASPFAQDGVVAAVLRSASTRTPSR
jgi:non-lysosomal glucosylceramidase